MQPSLFSLLPQVVDAVRMPVIAAGRVGDGRTIAAAFMLGASAVRSGRRSCAAGKQATLTQADDSCTVVTDLISGRPARYIRNRLVDNLVASGLKPLPIPLQLSLTWQLGEAGDKDWAVLLSGQSAALARDTNAAELVASLADEAGRRLRAFA